MQTITSLSHEELKHLYKEGKISVRANMSVAMHICDRDPRIPTATKVAHHFYKLLGVAMFFGGPISIFFIKWYWGVLIFFGGLMLFNASRQSAGQFVVEAVLESESLYYECLAAGALLITER